MFKQLIPTIAATVLASLCLLPTEARSQAWSGDWHSSEGNMTLGYNSGTYTQDNGRLFFDVHEFGGSYVLEGIWVEDGSAQRCRIPKDDSYYWGLVRFDFSDDLNSFEGVWSYCDNTTNLYKWTGWRP
jgi:hypothetical protein